MNTTDKINVKHIFTHNSESSGLIISLDFGP